MWNLHIALEEDSESRKMTLGSIRKITESKQYFTETRAERILSLVTAWDDSHLVCKLLLKNVAPS